MGDTIKVLGQSNPSAASLTDAYEVPGGATAVISSITVANRSNVGTSFRISVAVAGVADSLEQYIYYDIFIPGNDTFIATIGPTLGAGDVVRVLATLATLSFNIFGTQIT